MTENKLIHAHVSDDSGRIETREIQIGVPIIVCHTQHVLVRSLQSMKPQRSLWRHRVCLNNCCAFSVSYVYSVSDDNSKRMLHGEVAACKLQRNSCNRHKLANPLILTWHRGNENACKGSRTSSAMMWPAMSETPVRLQIGLVDSSTTSRNYPVRRAKEVIWTGQVNTPTAEQIVE